MYLGHSKSAQTKESKGQHSLLRGFKSYVSQSHMQFVHKKQCVVTWISDIGNVFMLILTRRVGEKLIIGDNVVVTVLGVKGNQVRVGINAPREVQVHREEIYNKIQQKTNGAAVDSD